MSLTMTQRRIAAEAADLLELFGWTQNRLWTLDEFGRCNGRSLYGALIDSATNSKVYGHNTRSSKLDAIAYAVAPADRNPVSWNDDPERTAEEVIARLREVAAA